MSYGFGPANSQSSYLPLEFELPKDEREMRELVSKRERLTANIVNIKENGNYELNEILTAQQWFNPVNNLNTQQKLYTFRKVINFGVLPNAGTKSVAHNIAVTNKTVFTKIIGTATNPAVQSVPLPYVNVGTPADGVELWLDPTNVNIKTTTANWIGFITVYIILEYIKGG